MRSVTCCVVEEITSGYWGIGGSRLPTADVKALAADVRRLDALAAVVKPEHVPHEVEVLAVG